MSKLSLTLKLKKNVTMMSFKQCTSFKVLSSMFSSAIDKKREEEKQEKVKHSSGNTEHCNRDCFTDFCRITFTDLSVSSPVQDWTHEKIHSKQ